MLIINSCKNEAFIEDRWKEISVRISNLQMNFIKEFFIDHNRKVDLVISVDNSYSMLDNQIQLGNSFDSFVANLDSTVDLHLSIVTSDSASPRGRSCFTSSYFYQIPNVIRTIGVDGSIFERPLEFGYEAIFNSSAACFRAGAHKFIFLVTDEDERKATEDESIDLWLQNWFIDQLNNHNINLFTVTDNYDDVALSNIVNNVGGTNYSIYGNYGVFLADFADDINLTTLTYSFSSDELADEIDPESVAVFLKPTGSSQYETMQMAGYKHKLHLPAKSRLTIKNESYLQGYDGIKINYSLYNTIKNNNRIIAIPTIPLFEDKIEVLVDNNLIEPTDYIIEKSIPAIILNDSVPLQIGSDVRIRYI